MTKSCNKSPVSNQKYFEVVVNHPFYSVHETVTYSFNKN